MDGWEVSVQPGRFAGVVHGVSLWLQRHPIVGDSAVAVMLLPFVAIGTFEGTGWWGLPWFLIAWVPLLWRRRWPEWCIAPIVVAHVVQLVVRDTFSPMNLLVPVCVYAAAAYSRAPWRWIWLAITAVGAIIGAWDWSYDSVLSPQTPSDRALMAVQNFIGMALVTATSWFMGQFARQRRLAMQSLRDRADALERERDQSAQLAVAEERARIAREMHDVVAHSLSLIVVQSDGASYALDHGADPPAAIDVARRALTTIGSTARLALTETRSLVGVLHEGDDRAELSPQATTAQIGDLVQSLVDAGRRATLTETGPASQTERWDVQPLSTATEHAAYRIVQEALTNVLKHAGAAASVDVHLHRTRDGVELGIRDDGPATLAPDGLGHGLIGMRERAASCGGTLVARNRSGGGFEVLATLPATRIFGRDSAPNPDQRPSPQREEPQ